MRLTLRAIVMLTFAAFSLLLLLRAANGTQTGFFPTPAPSQQYYTATGVLESYGIGMKSGIVRIKLSSGSTMDFYVSTTMSIDGKNIKCVLPPIGSMTPPPFMCKDWPSTLVLGKTSVTVTYWKTTRISSPVNATNKMVY